jgi:2-keto-4-pentenoate hydratase/2-oxohepta-3-ene-1,7-dioic acid hydratase in catechol pathway
MKMITGFCRFEYRGRLYTGVREGEFVVPTGMFGDPPGAHPIGAELGVDTVHMLTPCDPTKIVLISKNYRERAAAVGAEPPKSPLMFLKPPSALIPSGGTILLPPNIGAVSCEIELAVVVGTTMSSVTPEEALNRVLGFTLLFDISAREVVESDVQMTRGKGFDTFAVIGTTITPGIDPSNVPLQLHHNGDLVVDTSTRDMVFSVAELLSTVSAVMTLRPGDVVSTGGAGADRPILSAGDELVGEAGPLSSLVASVAPR